VGEEQAAQYLLQEVQKIAADVAAHRPDLLAEAARESVSFHAADENPQGVQCSAPTVGPCLHLHLHPHPPLLCSISHPLHKSVTLACPLHPHATQRPCRCLAASPCTPLSLSWQMCTAT
jgi:hypothetical protein